MTASAPLLQDLEGISIGKSITYKLAFTAKWKESIDNYLPKANTLGSAITNEHSSLMSVVDGAHTTGIQVHIFLRQASNATIALQLTLLLQISTRCRVVLVIDLSLSLQDTCNTSSQGDFGVVCEFDREIAAVAFFQISVLLHMLLLLVLSDFWDRSSATVMASATASHGNLGSVQIVLFGGSVVGSLLLVVVHDAQAVFSHARGNDVSRVLPELLGDGKGVLREQDDMDRHRQEFVGGVQRRNFEFCNTDSASRLCVVAFHE